MKSRARGGVCVREFLDHTDRWGAGRWWEVGNVMPVWESLELGSVWDRQVQAGVNIPLSVEQGEDRVCSRSRRLHLPEAAATLSDSAPN